MSVMVILSFCFVLNLKAPAHLDCHLLRRMRRRYWRVNFNMSAPSPLCDLTIKQTPFCRFFVSFITLSSQK